MKIGILGCSGRMGRNLLKEVISTDGCFLSGGLSKAESDFIGYDLGLLAGLDNLGITVSDDVESFVSEADVIIDFTTPASTMNCLELTSRLNTAHIIGTTGLSGEQISNIENYAKKIPIVHSHNMSMGINILSNLVEQVARTLDDSFDIEIVEMHHKHKVDAPSGTALTLGKAAADGRNIALHDVARKTRDGQIGERETGEIGFSTIRGGDVIGDHTVIFAGNGERIELTHKASNRSIYASGAVRAAIWIEGKSSGLYSMKDVLGLS